MNETNESIEKNLSIVLENRKHYISRAATAFALMALVEGDTQGLAPR